MKAFLLLTLVSGYVQSRDFFSCPATAELTTEYCERNCHNFDPAAVVCLYTPSTGEKNVYHPLVYSQDGPSANVPSCFVQCLREERILTRKGQFFEMDIRVGKKSSNDLQFNTIGIMNFLKFSLPVKNITIMGDSEERGEFKIKPFAFSEASEIETFTATNFHALSIDRYSFDLRMYDTVTSLNISNCGLKSFPEVLKHSLWKELENLVLSGNEISSFPNAKENGTVGVLYRNIMSAKNLLDLSENKFSEVALSPVDSSPPALISFDKNQLSSLPNALYELYDHKKQVEVSLARNSIDILEISNVPYTSFPKWGMLILTGVSRNIKAACDNALRKATIEFRNGHFRVCVDESVSGTFEGIDLFDDWVDPRKSTNKKLVVISITLATSILLVAILAAYFRHRRRIFKEAKNRFHYHQSDPSEDPAKLNTLKSLASNKDLSSVRFAMSDVYKVKKIGSGAFGEVWIGKYKHQEVAIKCLHSQHIFSSKEKVDQFVAEIKRVSTLSHPNIVTFIGTAWTNTTNLFMITEFMNCGDLCRILHTEAHIELSWEKEKLKMALDISSGLAYLHAQKPLPIIHRDLKSRNVLVDSNAGCKLTDFGLSRNLSYDETMTNVGIGTVRWTSPEIILGYEYDEFSDIYSFGVILSELDTREIPYSKTAVTESGEAWSDVALAHQVALGKLRPDLTQDVPKDILKLAHECMQADRALRPSASIVVERLSVINFD